MLKANPLDDLHTPAWIHLYSLTVAVRNAPSRAENVAPAIDPCQNVCTLRRCIDATRASREHITMRWR
jgi:hypothetical protein